MEAVIARSFARRSHAGQRSRFGERMTDHVERVARSLPEEARALGYLHDVLERAPTTGTELRANGVTDIEYAVLKLLTHRPGETYAAYVERIAGARGAAGRLARMVKRADLDDHLGHSRIPLGAPDYQWARTQIVAAQRRRREGWSANGTTGVTVELQVRGQGSIAQLATELNDLNGIVDVHAGDAGKSGY